MQVHGCAPTDFLVMEAKLSTFIKKGEDYLSSERCQNYIFHYLLPYMHLSYLIIF